MAHTAQEVGDVRLRTGFDQKAMSVPGVVGVGTGGSGPDEAWISVLCKDETARDAARATLGTEVEGVPIRLELSGEIRPL